MKTIGLIGGMSWESSKEYYRIINEEVKNRLGGLHSAQCILFSVDFAEIERYQANGEWDRAGAVLANAASSLEKAGADYIVICTNTMHKVVSEIEANITIPVLHIADATVKQMQEFHIKKVGLLGTKYTMVEDIYTSRIEACGIKVLIPDREEIDRLNDIIFKELCLGTVKQDSKEFYQKVIRNLVDRGAEGIILGCTEIGLLVKPEDAEVPLFDTAVLHAIEAVNLAMEE
ncbi:aspartate/glutamate racemase family protein [Neobacillus dielmonensis]|uniref:aspartate/glutamate racemase family protein n=1 Tax=Neobacillus dielmonensis TaxID=1347369 RepID=UPI0005AB4E64|nr:aspartate/glutamate racemase family protein [Neobacillus dielmonensis]